MNQSFWQRKRVVVTGANGFIGAHLVRGLAKAKAEVFALTGRHGSWRLEDVRGKIDVETIDICNGSLIEQFYRRAKPSVTFHAAAYGVRHSDQDVIQATTVNVLGGLNLLNASRVTRAHSFVNLGTRYESGQDRGNVREDDPQSPYGVYGTTKHAAQLIMADLARRKGMCLRMATLFGAYGPMEETTKFIPYVITSLMRGVPLQLTACEQVRNYSYIDDIILCLMRLGEIDLPGVSTTNLGSMQSHTLKQIVKYIAALLNGDAEIEFGKLPYRAEEIWNLVPDLSKCRKLLGFVPSTPITEGLKKTIDWYKAQLAQRNNVETQKS